MLISAILIRERGIEVTQFDFTEKSKYDISGMLPQSDIVEAGYLNRMLDNFSVSRDWVYYLK